jgi:phosphoribosylformimino-5-aminoimidazole carboxamide ribotide isomerase
MIVYPAIDIIDGRCVRLQQGDFDKCKFYDRSPVDIARGYADRGFTELHVVDLDGSREARPVSLDIVERIVQETKMTVQFGGGVRTHDDVKAIFDRGAQRVIVGTLAATEPSIVRDWVERYGAERVVLAADVQGNRIRVNAWREDSEWNLMEYLEAWKQNGVRRVLCTDVSRDGRMAGPSIALYEQIKAAHSSLYLVASGGIRSIDDILALSQGGIESAVVGKALLEGAIDAASLAANYGK